MTRTALAAGVSGSPATYGPVQQRARQRQERVVRRPARNEDRRRKQLGCGLVGKQEQAVFPRIAARWG